MASEPAAAGPVLPQVGIGTDIHAFEEGRELWCAGLKWEGEGPGLAGHSDADVVAHAACNALFSAAGLGDLGQHFGTGRPEWSGASGVTLLTEAARIVRAAGFTIGNVAVQVVGAAAEDRQAARGSAEGAVGGGGRAGVGVRRDDRRARVPRARGRADGGGHGTGGPPGLSPEGFAPAAPTRPIPSLGAAPPDPPTALNGPRPQTPDGLKWRGRMSRIRGPCAQGSPGTRWGPLPLSRDHSPVRHQRPADP